VVARQIIAGAPIDVFVSADQEKMDALQRRRLIDPGSRRRVLRNSLVIVVPAQSGNAMSHARDLLSPLIRSVAIGEPQSVPAGIYARQYLTAAGLWTALSPKLLPMENPRSALAAVEAGNADAAIVYRTDALSSRRVRIAWEVPLQDTAPIIYPAAVVSSSGNHETAAGSWLSSGAERPRRSFSAMAS
jgi:molybdate transport system substrate-binding protein